MKPLFKEVQAAGAASAYEEAWSGGGRFAGRAPDSPLRDEAERIAPRAPVGELLGVELAVASRRPPRRGSGERDPDRSRRLHGGNGRRGASAFPGSRSGRRGARRSGPWARSILPSEAAVCCASGGSVTLQSTGASPRSCCG